MRIKVIDLLNKIANGEEVPEKIKYRKDIYKYIKHWEQYVDENDDPLLYIISKSNYSCLNDEVEIIEEEPEIDIQALKEINEQSEFGKDIKDLRAVRINELIKAIKQLDKQIKENYLEEHEDIDQHIPRID